MSELLDLQQRFFNNVFRLIGQVTICGYRGTFGDAYRDPRATFPYSHPKSLHGRRLAIDINLFMGHTLLTGDEGAQAHRIIHEFWERECGGSPMIEGDENHYSMSFEGMR